MKLSEIKDSYFIEAKFEKQNYEEMVITVLNKDNHLLFSVQSGRIVLDDTTNTIRIKDEKTFEKVKVLFDELVERGSITISREFPGL